MDIETLHEVGGGPLVGYYAKGHLDKEEFIKELEIQHEVVDLEKPPPDDVVHGHIRFVPNNVDGGMIIETGRAGSKGAFPATVWEW